MTTPALYGRLARYYDRIYEWKDYATEAARLWSIGRRELGRSPRSLLDVACGTGRHLAEFRARIPTLAGVDASAAMLREARRRLGTAVPLTRGDMRSFDLGRQFDLAVCLFSAIGYLHSRRDRDRALATLYRHVVPGGVAFVEGWIRPEAWRDRTIHLQTYKGSDATIARLSTSWRVGRRSVQDMHYLIGEPGRRIVHVAETHREALISSQELLGSFRRAGFRARVLVQGPYRDRGLYIGVRPRKAAGARVGPASRRAANRPTAA